MATTTLTPGATVERLGRDLKPGDVLVDPRTGRTNRIKRVYRVPVPYVPGGAFPFLAWQAIRLLATEQGHMARCYGEWVTVTA